MRTPLNTAPTMVPINSPFVLLSWFAIDASVDDGVVAAGVSVSIGAGTLGESVSTSVELKLFNSQKKTNIQAGYNIHGRNDIPATFFG